jgi:hypothetical protein
MIDPHFILFMLSTTISDTKQLIFHKLRKINNLTCLQNFDIFSTQKNK